MYIPSTSVRKAMYYLVMSLVNNACEEYSKAHNLETNQAQKEELADCVFALDEIWETLKDRYEQIIEEEEQQ